MTKITQRHDVAFPVAHLRELANPTLIEEEGRFEQPKNVAARGDMRIGFGCYVKVAHCSDDSDSE